MQCGFGSHLANYCTITSNTIRITKPKSVVLSTGTEYDVFITTKCGTNPGLIFGVSGFFTATINFSDTGVGITESGTLDFTVYPTGEFTNSNLRVMHENAG